MCPHCGYDLHLDLPILINDFAMAGMGSALIYKSRSVNLTGAESALCYSLMKSFPAALRVDVILDRIGSEATGNVVQVLVCRIRKKLCAVGGPCPIISARRRGQIGSYFWDADAA